MVVLLTTLFVVGCNEKTTMERVPDAEKAYMTESGHLFVSGGKSFYMVSKNEDGSFVKNALTDETGNYGGVSEYNGYLYVIGGKPGMAYMVSPPYAIYIAKIDDLVASAEAGTSCDMMEVFSFDGVMGPNGMDIDKNGNIYVAAMTSGEILRFKISEEDPYSLEGPEVWLSKKVNTPNGIAIQDQTLYFTDIGQVKTVDIGEDGSPGEVDILMWRSSVLDDLIVVENGLMVADFVLGSIFYLSFDGKIESETLIGTFTGPSSVCMGKAPMFDDGDIIVTEKGVLYDTVSRIGNRITLFQPANDFF